MGLEFIRKVAKTFHKGLDNSRIELCTPDLFKKQPQKQPRLYTATICGKRKLHQGDKLIVKMQNSNVVTLIGIDIVAKLDKPTDELIEAINNSYGEACGTVEETYDIADKIEITVC